MQYHNFAMVAYTSEKSLFRKYTNLSFKACNRFVAQAMEINAANKNGGVTEIIIQRYENLAKGNWGIVFVEAIGINQISRARKNGLVITKENLDGYKKLVSQFKKINGKSLLFFQITHPGRYNHVLDNRIKIYHDDDFNIPVASEDEIEKIIDDFVIASSLAFEAGADGVDIKACHGYLGAEFLRQSNRRSDNYGGSLDNRIYFLSSIIKELKKNHPEKIVGTRISLYEGIRGGCGTASPDDVIEDLVDIMSLLSGLIQSGLDFINVSAGIPSVTPLLTRPDQKSIVLLYNHFRYTKLVKDTFKDVAVIGSAYSTGFDDGLNLASENISKEYTDFAGFGRQNLADPLMPLKILKGEDFNRCTLCGGCSRLLKKQEKVRCIVYG